MKKKVISILLAAVMVAGLAAGCGSKNEKEDAGGEEGVTTVTWMTSRPVERSDRSGNA